MITEQIIQIILQLSVNICKHFVIKIVLHFTSWSLSGSKEQEIAYMNGFDFAWQALSSNVRILKSCRRCVGYVSAVGNQEFFAAVTMESISGFISVAWQLLVGKSLLVIQASRSHSFRHTTLGRTSLDVWSARRRELYVTIHSTYKRETSMPPKGFEPAIPASERPQTHAFDRTATGIGRELFKPS
jgi:hypothetical protein